MPFVFTAKDAKYFADKIEFSTDSQSMSFQLTESEKNFAATAVQACSGAQGAKLNYVQFHELLRALPTSVEKSRKRIARILAAVLSPVELDTVLSDLYHAEADGWSPVARGSLLRGNLLCTSLQYAQFLQYGKNMQGIIQETVIDESIKLAKKKRMRSPNTDDLKTELLTIACTLIDSLTSELADLSFLKKNGRLVRDTVALLQAQDSTKHDLPELELEQCSLVGGYIILRLVNGFLIAHSILAEKRLGKGEDRIFFQKLTFAVSRYLQEISNGLAKSVIDSFELKLPEVLISITDSDCVREQKALKIFLENQSKQVDVLINSGPAPEETLRNELMELQTKHIAATKKPDSPELLVACANTQKLEQHLDANGLTNDSWNACLGLLLKHPELNGYEQVIFLMVASYKAQDNGFEVPKYQHVGRVGQRLDVYSRLRQARITANAEAVEKLRIEDSDLVDALVPSAGA